MLDIEDLKIILKLFISQIFEHNLTEQSPKVNENLPHKSFHLHFLVSSLQNPLLQTLRKKFFNFKLKKNFI
jgi:hypothetical protein